MKKLDLTPSSSQMKWFMDSVLKFHKKVAAQYMIYFKTGLESKVLKYCESLDPKERTKITTKSRILYMAKTVPKIVKNIDFFSGMDKLESELEISGLVFFSFAESRLYDYELLFGLSIGSLR